jgi:Cys-tRNA(Pro)/Cys-tRNA(Cys) deacylase
MKKKFPTFFDSSAEGLEKLTVSAGMKGAQLLVESKAILKYTEATLGDFAIDPVK